ncbi:MAG: OB-fold domain-containing protein [Chloroflexi bacterium]|nr:OB-fold domain-containing protein [Chloroflexota bacterium]
MTMKETMAPYGVLPQPDQHTQPFWDAAKEHRLVIQRCQRCRHYHHPPVFLCTNCNDPKATLAFEGVSGRGTVYAHYVHHFKNIGGFEDKAPYPVVAVELEEQRGLLMVTNILHCPYDQLRVGMPVEVVFEKASDEITIPQFRPRK